MRQVGRDELIHLLYDGQRGITPAVRNMLVDRRSEVRDRGRMIVAEVLADKFARLEIVSSTPPPPPFRFKQHGAGSDEPMFDDWTPPNLPPIKPR